MGCIGFFFLQKKKEEDKAKEKELNDLFKVAVSQPKVPPGMSYVLSLATTFVILVFHIVVVV